MDVRNCRKCGKVFNYVTGLPICQSCRETEEEKFQEVKKYVWDNKQAGIDEVVEVCGVTRQQITNWIRQERLVFSESSMVGINCESCGTMIRTGRFCEKCKTELARGLSNSIKPAASAAPEPRARKVDKENPRMRYLD